MPAFNHNSAVLILGNYITFQEKLTIYIDDYTTMKYHDCKVVIHHDGVVVDNEFINYYDIWRMECSGSKQYNVPLDKDCIMEKYKLVEAQPGNNYYIVETLSPRPNVMEDEKDYPFQIVGVTDKLKGQKLVEELNNKERLICNLNCELLKKDKRRN